MEGLQDMTSAGFYATIHETNPVDEATETRLHVTVRLGDMSADDWVTFRAKLEALRQHTIELNEWTRAAVAAQKGRR